MPRASTWNSPSPHNYTDPTGHIAVLAVAWAVFEIGSFAYDAYNTYQTFTDPCASGWDKVLTGGLTAMSLIAPGGGNTAALNIARRAPNTILPKPAVTHSKLQNIVNDLYKGTTNPTRAGTGTTADAVRNELATGQATGGTFHLQKAEQYSNALRGVLKQGLSGHDALVAQSLLDDLQRAMRGLP